MTSSSRGAGFSGSWPRRSSGIGWLAFSARGGARREILEARYLRAATRIERLHGDGVVSDDELDRVTADARAQAAVADRASARLVEIKRGARVEDRQAAGARLRAARARLQVTEANLSRRRVVAANAGTVLLSRLHVGEFFNAGPGPLFVLGDMTRLQVRLEGR